MLLAIQFLHPIFLYGLFALAIPIVLHLFSFRKYKKVYFSNFNFLASLQQQKKNSSKLKNLLLLFLRLLVLASIVIAFATPYVIPEKTTSRVEKSSKIIIYTDNSFSMSNTGTKGSLLEEAKKHLFDIINAYPAGTSFVLLSNDEANNTPLTKDQAITLLPGIKATANSKKISEILKEAREIAAGQHSTLFILSDFQKKNCDFQSIQPDSTLEKVLLVLSPENRNNLYIKDVKFDQAFHKKDQADKVTITLVNASGKEYNNVPLSLTINDKKKSLNKINIPANGEKQVEINYQNTEDGFYKGIVEISDFPVLFDNKFYFSYGIEDKAAILCIEQNGRNPYFQKLFADSATFSYTYRNVNQTVNMNFSRYNLIILDRLGTISSGLGSALENYVQNGGNLFVIPGSPNTVTALNRLCQQMHAPLLGSPDTGSTIATIETQATIFRDVFEKEEKNPQLPHAKHFYHLTNTGNSEKLLTDKKGFTVLAAQTFGKGSLYLSAFDYSPDNSDMVYHPLFVPLMVNMASNMNSALNTSYFLNSDKPVILNNKIVPDNARLRIVNSDRDFEFIPESRKDFSGNLILSNAKEIRDAGLYEVEQDGKIVDVLAYNYNRDESQMEFCGEEILRKQFPEARTENIKSTQLNRNSELVKEIVLEDNNRYLTFWFLLLAIMALLLEQTVWKKRLM